MLNDRAASSTAIGIETIGTIAEGNIMISRINDFDKLYLEPSGHNLFVGYKDKPGVIGKVASLLGKNNINIIDIRAPQDLKSSRSLAAVKTNLEVPQGLLEEIREAVDACVVFSFTSK